MVGFRLYWVDTSLPGVRSIRLDGSDHRVMLRAQTESFLDVTVYHVSQRLQSASRLYYTQRSGHTHRRRASRRS